MNTFMYEHPLTAEHIRIVRDVVRYNVVGPIGKKLACGDVGKWGSSFFYVNDSMLDARRRCRSYDGVA